MADFDYDVVIICRHQHSLSFISASMSSKSGLCRSKSQLRRLKAVFLLFGAAPHPRIATSTSVVHGLVLRRNQWRPVDAAISEITVSGTTAGGPSISCAVCA